MLYSCPYCTWQAEEPSRAEYPDTYEGNAHYYRDMNEFWKEQREHENCNRDALAEFREAIKQVANSLNKANGFPPVQ